MQPELDQPAPEDVLPETELDEFGQVERRRKRWIALVVGVLVIGVGGLIMWRRATGLPGIDPQREKDVRAALPEIERLPPEVQRGFASRAIAELEHERLPASMIAAFDEHASLPPGFAAPILLEAFVEDEAARAAWLIACPNDGFQVLADVGAQGSLVQLYERCELARLGLLAQDELGGVSASELVLTHAAWAYLDDRGSPSELERRLFRMVMGR